MKNMNLKWTNGSSFASVNNRVFPQHHHMGRCKEFLGCVICFWQKEIMQPKNSLKADGTGMNILLRFQKDVVKIVLCFTGKGRDVFLVESWLLGWHWRLVAHCGPIYLCQKSSKNWQSFFTWNLSSRSFFQDHPNLALVSSKQIIL